MNDLEGHSMLSELSLFDKPYISPCCWSLLCSNNVSILHRFSDIARYWSEIADLTSPVPTYTCRLQWEKSHWNFRFCEDHQKLQSRAIVRRFFA